MRFIFYFVFLRWFIRILFWSQTDPIETLYVSIEGDTTALMDDIDEGVDKASDKLEGLDTAGKKTGQGLKGSAGIAGAAFGLAAGAAGKLLDMVLNLAVAIPQFFANLGKEAVQANAQFETFSTQFETLLGSAGAAKQRLEELARFGVETPFELPEVVQANIQLQTFGGNVLATEENLRLLGDAAAANAAPFSETAVWFGRLFSQLQGGKPFGEAAQRLQELAILAPEVRTEMEAMQKQGKSGAEIWAFFSEQVGGKFGGAMEKLAKTFEGVTSNLADFKGELIRKGGEEFFEEIRQSAVDFYTFLQDNEEVLIGLAQRIGDLAAGVVRFFREGISGINVKPLIDGIKSFLDWIDRVRNSAGAFFAMLKSFGQAVAPIFTPIISVLKTVLSVGLMPITKNLGFLWDALKRVDEALVAGAQVLALSAAGWKGLLATLAPIGEVISKIGQSLLALVKGDFARSATLAGEAMDQIKEGLFDVDGGVKAMEDSIKASAKAIDAWINPAEEIKEEIESVPPAEIPPPELPPPDKTAEIAQKFTNQLIDATENRNEQLEQLEEDHAEKVSEIMANANEKRLDINDKFSEDMADLADDSEKARLKVIEDTAKELVEAADETDRQLKARREDFNQDELRETEDHLKEMRRLQEDFLFDLSDAVRDRDARAVVDLQRQFEKESSRKEEDFSQGQGRQREDLDAELSAIRENESQKRDELLAAQTQELEDIRQNEEEKKNELEARRNDELEKLGENLKEQLAKQNESFRERQDALDEALQKQLEAIGKNLADEKEVTEEGAQSILETFDEYFGIGGNIDEIMDKFSRRRKIKADISVEFSKGEEPAPEPKRGPVSALAPLLGRPRLGGVQEFGEGGTLLASKPTLALFGENGPEVAQFTPMADLSSPGGGEPGRMIIEMTGSAPPGIGAGDRDAIAGVLLTALRDTGALAQ